MFAQIIREEGDIGGPAVAVAGGKRNRVPPLVAKQLFEPPADEEDAMLAVSCDGQSLDRKNTYAKSTVMGIVDAVSVAVSLMVAVMAARSSLKESSG